MKRITFLLCWIVVGAQAQTTIDSLYEVSKKQKNESLVATYVNLSWEYRNSNLDSAVFYANKTLALSKQFNYQKGIASGYNSLACSYQASGLLDSAAVYHKKSIAIQYVLKDSIGIADSYNNLGIIADESSDYKTALDQYFKALRIYERSTDAESNVPMVYSNIGIVYKKQKEFQKTLGYYKKALAIYEKTNNKVGATIMRGNIGSLFIQLREYKKAIAYATTAKDEYEKLGYQRYVPYMLVNRAVAKDSLKQHLDAQVDYELAIKQFQTDSNLYELTNAFIGYGQNQLYRNQNDAAKSSLNRALTLAKQNKFKEFEIRSYMYLAKAHAKTGDYKAAYNFQKKYRIGNDSLFEAAKTKSILELDVKYQSEKKEKELALQKAELLQKEIKLKQRNNLLFLLALGLLFAVLLGYLFVRQQRLKNRQLQQENELNEAKAKIETEQKLQEQRLRISRDLHDNIGSQLTFVISSLDNLKYAKNISDKVTNDKLGSLSNFTRSTITELRDTIWAMNHDRITLADLQERLTSHLNQAASTGVETAFSIHTAPNLDTAISYDAEAGMHIFRIIQESINNTLKYANASLININFEEANKMLIVTITDDGKGFDTAIASNGNGLRNMQERVAFLSGTVNIKSEIANGTVVTLKAPLI